MTDKNVHELYDSTKAKREPHVPLWEKIARVAGMNVKINYDKTNKGNKSDNKDQYIDDPTSAISINQA